MLYEGWRRYFGIDEAQLWKGAKEFAPDAIAKIEQMVEYQRAKAEDEAY